MSDVPAISVIVPCRNERAHIEACVRSILAQQPPPGGFELLVVDGMSDDGTREILARLAREDARVRLIDNVQQVKGPALNLGLGQASGRYVAVLDAHSRYAPDYVAECLAVMEETQAASVGGAVYTEGDTWLSRAICAAHHARFAVGGGTWHDPTYEGPTDTASGGFFRRSVLEAVGAWDEELVRNQDDELSLRLTRAGHTIYQSPRIKTWYRPRGSLPKLWNQYKQYGYWKVRVIQKHKLPSTIRQLVPATFVLALAGSALGGVVFPPLWAGGLGLAGLYMSASVAASISTAAKTEWALLPILPAVFACYHFAYGYGFLRGVLDFAVKGKGGAPTFTAVTR